MAKPADEHVGECGPETISVDYSSGTWSCSCGAHGSIEL